MNLNKKRIGLSLLILIILLLVATGFVKKYNTDKTASIKTSDSNTTDQKNITKEIAIKTPKKDKFQSNDEIKKEYGKLETVYLWNGRSYTGAVISTTEIYSIVTVNGTINIPMKDVKMRDIIR